MFVRFSAAPALKPPIASVPLLMVTGPLQLYVPTRFNVFVPALMIPPGDVPSLIVPFITMSFDNALNVCTPFSVTVISSVCA